MLESWVLIQITSAKYRVDFSTQQCFEIVAQRIDYNGDNFYYTEIVLYSPPVLD